MKKIFILLIIVCNYFIAQSQNVGIGTSTPAGKLHIKGSADTSQLTIDANATQSNTHPLIRFRNAAGKDIMHIHSDDVSNVFIGLSAGKNNNASGGGTYNSFTGSNAGYSNTTGNSNAACGSAALYSNTTGNSNTANGFAALAFNTTGHDNTASGDAALYFNTTGNYNTANGSSALYYNSAGSYNTSSGYQSLNFNTTGNDNTAAGYNALFSNTNGDQNIANGPYALYSNTSGNLNTATGYQSLYSNTNGYQNTAFGPYALYANNIGIRNTATGRGALEFNATGNYNTADGTNALVLTTASDYNTAVGYNAGSNYDNGYNNVFIGANVDVTGAGFYNVIAIGQGTVVTGSSNAIFGNAATGYYGGYANWSNVSDGRFKKNIRENVPGLDFINKLRPVTYNLDATGLDVFLHKNNKNTAIPSDKSQTLLDNKKASQQNDAAKAVYNKALHEKEIVTYTGFVAQEVETTAKTLGFDFSGIDAPKDTNGVYSLRYAEFVVPLVKAVQEQQQQIESLKNTNVDLQRQIDELKMLIKK